MDLNGRTILITGSTDGVGRRAALMLGAAGARVLVHGRDRERGEQAVEELRRNGGTAPALYSAAHWHASCMTLKGGTDRQGTMSVPRCFCKQPKRRFNMQKLLACCAAPLSLLLLGACTATTSAGLGDETGTADLPVGAALLESDDSECDGTVRIGAETIDDDGLSAEHFVEPGENATFELADETTAVEWSCAGPSSAEIERMECPDGTSHVRLTRAQTGGEVLLECYGG